MPRRIPRAGRPRDARIPDPEIVAQIGEGAGERAKVAMQHGSRGEVSILADRAEARDLASILFT
jgi:hypothetical protein